MKNANVLSKLLSLGAQIDSDGSFSLENLGNGVSGKIGCIHFYYFEGAGCVSKGRSRASFGCMPRDA